MDDTDFDLLCKGLTADEAKQLRKIFREWSSGDENDFPVQLALLTRAQWNAAAAVPRAVNDSRKLIERHLAEYRLQTKLMIDAFSHNTEQQHAATRTALETHGNLTKQTVTKFQVRLAEVEATARQIKTLMDGAAAEWQTLKASTTHERDRLERISNSLQERFSWRGLLWSCVLFLLTLSYGICIGHYFWKLLP